MDSKSSSNHSQHMNLHIFTCMNTRTYCLFLVNWRDITRPCRDENFSLSFKKYITTKHSEQPKREISYLEAAM